MRDVRGGALDPAGEVAGHHQGHEDRGQQGNGQRDDQGGAERLLDVGRLGRGVSDTGLDEVVVEDAGATTEATSHEVAAPARSTRACATSSRVDSPASVRCLASPVVAAHSPVPIR